MGKYRIADLVVEMQPKYEKQKLLSQDYACSESAPSDIVINIADDFFEEKKANNPHLTYSDIENIWTCFTFQKQIIDFDGLVIHASAIAIKDKAILFSGKKGVGKTTHAKLWQKAFQNVKILNDDKPPVRCLEEGIFVYGSPWCGNSIENVNDKVKLGAIVFLEQADKNQMDLIEVESQKVYMILKNTFRPKESIKMQKLLTSVEKIAVNVPVYRLRCTADMAAVQACSEKILSEVEKK